MPPLEHTPQNNHVLAPLCSADTEHGFAGIVGQSKEMRKLFELLKKVIKTTSTVLITGENGTGKELVAKAIHKEGMRADDAFVVQNCSAFNDNLLDSELFGHKRGSFTGAVADKKGLFEAADKGTFFLDEIGEMSPALQVKVLRVLQEGTLTPVGDTVVKHVDVRVIAATNRRLERMVESGEFRQDLYYRVNVIHVELPPLREREGDVELLANVFLKKLSNDLNPTKVFSAKALAKLNGYSWPGNVRELENEVERCVVLAGTETTIEASLLSERILLNQERLGPTGLKIGSLPDAVKKLEIKMIKEALVEFNGNKTKAAIALCVSRRNLLRLVQKYEIEPIKKNPNKKESQNGTLLIN